MSNWRTLGPRSHDVAAGEAAAADLDLQYLVDLIPWAVAGAEATVWLGLLCVALVALACQRPLLAAWLERRRVQRRP